MRPFKQILVAVDFSDPSEEAIRYAADLSVRYGGALTLLHVFEPLAYALTQREALAAGVQLDGLLAQVDQKLALTKSEALAAGALQVETKLLEGIPSDEILSFAEKLGADLIVTGTHGRTGLKHVLIGSVAEKVVRHAACPVLTVRKQKEK